MAPVTFPLFSRIFQLLPIKTHIHIELPQVAIKFLNLEWRPAEDILRQGFGDLSVDFESIVGELFLVVEEGTEDGLHFIGYKLDGSRRRVEGGIPL